jgi:hypothetical protein
MAFCSTPPLSQPWPMQQRGFKARVSASKTGIATPRLSTSFADSSVPTGSLRLLRSSPGDSVETFTFSSTASGMPSLRVAAPAPSAAPSVVMGFSLAAPTPSPTADSALSPSKRMDKAVGLLSRAFTGPELPEVGGGGTQRNLGLGCTVREARAQAGGGARRARSSGGGSARARGLPAGGLPLGLPTPPHPRPTARTARPSPRRCRRSWRACRSTTRARSPSQASI